MAVMALIALLFAVALQAQQPPANVEQNPVPSRQSLEQQSQEAFAAGNAQLAHDVNLQLHQRYPYIGEYMYDFVRAAALLDLKTEAYEMMLHMQRQGLSYDFNKTEDTLNIRRTELYGYLNDVLVEAGKPAGDAAVAFKLSGTAADFQAIAWDASREKFLVGTAKEGLVLAVAEDGSSEVLLRADADNGLWSINGLAVDAAGNRLWISSAATPKFAGFKPSSLNHGALFEFKLDTLEKVGTYFLPIDELPHELGSLALTDDGHVYVIDRALPFVYRKTRAGDHLEAFVTSRELVAFSDVTVAPDNSRLFVADPVKGVFVVDPVAEQAAMLAGPENLNLGGIEGIEYSNGRLFIVQGGLQPQRLMRLQLAANGSAVESVAPMAVAMPEFDRPGNAAIRGDALYYLANPAATNGEDGLLVMRTALDAGNEIVPPDLRRFRQNLQKNKQ